MPLPDLPVRSETLRPPSSIAIWRTDNRIALSTLKKFDMERHAAAKPPLFTVQRAHTVAMDAVDSRDYCLLVRQTFARVVDTCMQHWPNARICSVTK